MTRSNFLKELTLHVHISYISSKSCWYWHLCSRWTFWKDVQEGCRIEAWAGQSGIGKDSDWKLWRRWGVVISASRVHGHALEITHFYPPLAPEWFHLKVQNDFVWNFWIWSCSVGQLYNQGAEGISMSWLMSFWKFIVVHLLATCKHTLDLSSRLSRGDPGQ